MDQDFYRPAKIIAKNPFNYFSSKVKKIKGIVLSMKVLAITRVPPPQP